MDEYSLNSNPVTLEELEAIRELAIQSTRLWAKRAALAGIVLVLTFASALLSRRGTRFTLTGPS